MKVSSYKLFFQQHTLVAVLLKKAFVRVVGSWVHAQDQVSEHLISPGFRLRLAFPSPLQILAYQISLSHSPKPRSLKQRVSNQNLSNTRIFFLIITLTWPSFASTNLKHLDLPFRLLRACHLQMHTSMGLGLRHPHYTMGSSILARKGMCVCFKAPHEPIRVPVGLSGKNLWEMVFRTCHFGGAGILIIYCTRFTLNHQALNSIFTLYALYNPLKRTIILHVDQLPPSPKPEPSALHAKPYTLNRAP